MSVKDKFYFIRMNINFIFNRKNTKYIISNNKFYFINGNLFIQLIY